MESRCLFYDRGKLAGMIALGLFGAGFSAWAGSFVWPAAMAGKLLAVIIAAAAVIGVAGSLALVVLAARRFITGGVAAVFDDDGVTITTLVRRHRLEWSEIWRIGFMDAAPNHIVKFAPESGKMKSYPLIGVRGVGRTVPQWYAEMLAHWPPNRFRRKYGRPYP